MLCTSRGKWVPATTRPSKTSAVTSCQTHKFDIDLFFYFLHYFEGFKCASPTQWNTNTKQMYVCFVSLENLLVLSDLLAVSSVVCFYKLFQRVSVLWAHDAHRNKPVSAAPPVCACEHLRPCWETPSSSWMCQLFHSPPCCHQPGSAARPSQSWGLGE